MPVRTTSKDSRGFGYSKVLDSHSLEFLSTKRTSGGTNTTPYVSSNLLFYVDAAKPLSYSGSGTTWTDLSGNGINMTLTNSPTFTSGTPSYFTFNGSNQYGSSNITNFNNTNTVSGTLEGWVNIIGTSGYRHIFGMRGSASNNFNFLLLNSSTTTEARVSTISTDTVDINYTGISSWNGWRQIVFVFDRSDYKTRLYINGSIVATSTGTLTNTFGTLNNFEVAAAAQSGFGAYTNMYGSKFLVYNKALSASEVLQNYNVFKGEFGLP